MRWRPDTVCAPHDHGMASGSIHVIEGRFEERRYRITPSGPVVISRQIVTAPAIVDAPVGVIHDMRALDAAGGLTVHRYAPQITRMRVYDVANHRVLIVSDDCGAWVPSPAEAHQIVHIAPWPTRAEGAAP